jgi:hypothetical protein
MEALTRRLATFKIYKALKEDDDSSGDEKANKGGGKKVKNLQPPRKPKSKWPPHLEKHYNELSARYRGRGFKTPIKTAINLLHVLNLDETACDVLHDEHVIENIVIELKAETMQFGEKLTGRGAFLVPVFKLLVKLDVKAAQQFHLLCDETTKDLLATTNEYGFIEKLPPAQPAFDRKQANLQRDLFIDKVESTIKGDPTAKAYATQLLLLVRGCPPSARKEVLKLLANDKVSEVCKESAELAAAVEALQGMIPAERGQVDTSLALLLFDINVAMARATVPGRRDFDFLQDQEVVALFAKLEKSLGEQQFDLTTLIATLCPGKLTTASQAKFVTGLMGHLIQGARDREEPFDFLGFLSATLLSGMPGACAKWIANSAVRTCQSAADVERLVKAIEDAGQRSGMKIAQRMLLGLWADIVGSDIRSSKYIDLNIKGELERTGLFNELLQRLQDVEERSRQSNRQLAAAFNAPDQN